MLINLIIIYFACGSPIGVYRVTRATHRRLPGQAAAVGAYFILWPIFATAILRRLLNDNAKSLRSDLERKLGSIRGKIETLAFAGSPALSVFELREVFSRYTGLTLALNSVGTVFSSNELFTIARHGNAALASACMDRRTRRRLSFHQSRSRLEFVALLAAISRSEPNRKEIIGCAVQVADLLNDKESSERFNKLARTGVQTAAG